MKIYIENTGYSGTKVLGSLYGRLITESAKDDYDFCFESESTLCFDPVQGKQFDPWWIIATSCEDIAAYYRNAIDKRFGIKLLKPSFNSHVSILRGEKPTVNENDWGFSHGLKVPFRYTHQLYTNSHYWWVRVASPDFCRLREHFGFPSEKTYHLTVGKL